MVKVMLILALASVTPSVFSQSDGRVLYAFADPLPNCFGPAAPLTVDSRGHIYGTATGGGTYGDGCVFELSPTPNGWIESTLWSFDGNGGLGGPVTLDTAGSLYGTWGGGTYGAGVAFKLGPQRDGTWAETVMHTFGAGDDGRDPQSDLIFDGSGNLYGTTTSGGSRQGGTVFRLTPGASGWTETILYSFPASIAGPDGDVPIGGVVMGLKGELYGVTQAGGTNGYGAVFELAPSGRSYAEKLIHSFDLSDGYQPGSGLTLSRSGDIYGTTLAGGDTSVCYYVGCGVVFELIRDANGDWNETVLHEMAVSDGADPLGPVVFDPSGSLYAAAQSGGAYDMGSVFRLTPTLGGNWSETVLHAFDFKFPNGEDGEHPYAGVVFEGGKVVGTAFSGGVNDSGIPFEIAPPQADSPGAATEDVQQ
jgi:uncharacterized repeat protein (TIGR03803 family)